MSAPLFRWGILGTAQIARKNWQAIYHSGNGTVAAVASRERLRSQQFIEECQRQAPMKTAPRALGSYEELIADPDVDAVYLPLPTGLRKQWVIRAAHAGKHVVCEKPCATSVADLQEMLAACRQHRVQFMDGVMFMHSLRLPQMRAVLDDGGSVGDLKRITSAFNFRASPDFFTSNIRAHSEMEPYGCLGDLGWYCIRLALWVMKGRMPHRVTGRILVEAAATGSPAPVPVEFSGELFFDNDVSSAFHCSFLVGIEQWAIVSGTKGSLRISDFVLPFFGREPSFEISSATHVTEGCNFQMKAESRSFSVTECSDSDPSAQETSLFRNFTEQARSGTLNESWPEMALKTQQVMSACLESARDGSPVLLDQSGGAPI
ncbi:MAG: hypothetical protein QOF48_1084 [Verrucomicrobiota bacterium]|jgi:predicted dehydrogenase